MNLENERELIIIKINILFYKIIIINVLMIHVQLIKYAFIYKKLISHLIQKKSVKKKEFNLNKNEKNKIDECFDMQIYYCL